MIIFDDVNTDRYQIPGRFFRKLLPFCIKKKISMMLTSNKEIDLRYFIAKSDLAIGPDSELSNNTLVINDINLESKRQKWSDNLDKKNSLIELIGAYNKNSSAGIFLTSDVINKETLEDIKQQLLKTNKDLKIRISDTPTESEKRWIEGKEVLASGIINDMFVKKGDHDKYDTFIVKVTNKAECEQFLHLMNHVHDNHAKIIVACDSKEKFNELLNAKFNEYNSLFKHDEKKLKDRIRVAMHDEPEKFIIPKPKISFIEDREVEITEEDLYIKKRKEINTFTIPDNFCKSLH